MSVSYGGDSITFADSSTISSGWTGFKNRIINGGMVIDQRNNGGSTTGTTALVFSSDRWASYVATDGVMTLQRSSEAPTGFANSIVATATTADTSLSSVQRALVLQRIEGYNIADLKWGTPQASPATLSFWVRSSLTGTFGGALTDTSRAYPFTYTISNANTWEYKTITIPGDTSGTWNSTNGWGVQIAFGLGVGSTFCGTANTWQNGDINSVNGTVSLMGTLNATWYLTGVQFEKGSTASSFEYRPFGTELALCQRYCEVLTANRDNSETLIGLGFAIASTETLCHFSYKVLKRDIPSVTLSSASHFTVLKPGTWTTCSSVTNTYPNINSCRVYFAVSGWGYTAGYANEWKFLENAGGKITVSAEL